MPKQGRPAEHSVPGWPGYTLSVGLALLPWTAAGTIWHRFHPGLKWTEGTCGIPIVRVTARGEQEGNMRVLKLVADNDRSSSFAPCNNHGLAVKFRNSETKSVEETIN